MPEEVSSSFTRPPKMTDRDWRTHSVSDGSSAAKRRIEVLAVVVGTKERAHVREQLVHRLTLMIARNIAMQILPDALDAIVIGTVRRQKVQDHFAIELGEMALRDLRRVDDEVVADDVDGPRVGVLSDERVEHGAEERAVLLGRFDPGDPASLDVPRASEIVLLILAGREHPALVAAIHPIEADLGIEMNVDFIGVENWLLVGAGAAQTQQLIEDAAFATVRPRAEHDRLRVSATRTDAPQRSAHRSDGNQRESPSLHFECEQLARPGRPLPAAISGPRVEQHLQGVEEILVDFVDAVVDSAVAQPVEAVRAESTRRLAHGRRCAAEQVSHPTLRATTGRKRCEDRDAKDQDAVPGLASRADELFSHGERELRYCRHRGLRGSKVVFGDFTLGHVALNFNLSDAGLRADRYSRAVI